MKHLLALAGALLLALPALRAHAAETPVRILTPAYVREAITALAPAIAARTGVTVTVETVGTGGIVERLAKGEAGDLVVTSKDSLAAPEVKDRIQAQRDVAVSTVGIAVGGGAPAPVLNTPDDLAAFLKAVPSFAYSTGPSGRHIAQVIERLGLTATMAPKVRTGSGLLGARLAAGEVAAVGQQVSELKLAGLTDIAPLPDAVQARIVVTAATVAGTARPDDVAKVVEVLAAADAAAAYENAGLIPQTK